MAGVLFPFPWVVAGSCCCHSISSCGCGIRLCVPPGPREGDGLRTPCSHPAPMCRGGDHRGHYRTDLLFTVWAVSYSCVCVSPHDEVEVCDAAGEG